MFTIDERLRGLPAVKDQIVALYESLNQPHLAVPGRQAGPARAFILGLRGPQGFAVFVYLYIPDSAQCAIYVPSSRAVSSEKYQAEEGDALAFVESMGFIMDNLNFRGRPAAEQDELIATMPLFQREPPGSPAAKKASSEVRADKEASSATATALGKLFSAFAFAALLVGLGGCKHVPSEKDRDAAGIHYDMGVEAQLKDPPTAMRQYEMALELDPEMAEAWHAKGVLEHMVFGKLDEARASYERALQINPRFSAALTNLGNVYLEQKRYDEAIKKYELALNDMTYREPWIAQANLGWARYKLGESRTAIENLKSSVTTNPKFCFGYLKLGNIYEEQGNLPEACRNYGKYRESCPEMGDSYLREGVCLSKMGQTEPAKKAFEACIAKDDVSKDDCLRLKDATRP